MELSRYLLSPKARAHGVCGPLVLLYGSVLLYTDAGGEAPAFLEWLSARKKMPNLGGFTLTPPIDSHGSGPGVHLRWGAWREGGGNCSAGACGSSSSSEDKPDIIAGVLHGAMSSAS